MASLLSFKSCVSSVLIRTAHQAQRTYVAARFLRPTKFQSIFHDVPVRPRSGWQVFVRENINEVKREQGKVSMPEVTKALTAKWHQLSETEKAPYIKMYEKESEAHLKAYQKALEKATPQQIYEENQLRKLHKLPLIKDPRHPKRPPMSAYMCFRMELLNNEPGFKQMPLGEQAKQANERFKAMSEQERKKYEELAAKNKKEYAEAKAKYMALIDKTRVPEKTKKSSGKKTDSTKSKTQKTAKK